LENVSFELSNRPIINDVGFRLEPGAFAALVGGNGAGKSTLLKIIMGLYRPARGAVYIDGEATRGMRVSAIAKKAGFLFQNPDRQIFGATVRAELAFGLAELGISSEEARRRVEGTLERLGLDGSRAPMSLSRGERQRVALAGLFARRPKILLLDEPTTGLDYRECMQMMRCVAELNEEGATILMVTHDMEVALDFAPRMLILADGQLMAQGLTRDLMRDAELLERASLMPAQIVALSARLGIAPGEADDVDSLTDWIAARRAAKGGTAR
jgi:energy-coupling factor transport system ATP-binding protein